MDSGDRVSCSYAGSMLEGTYITKRDGKAVIKLGNGYNIGVSFDAVTKTGDAEKREVVKGGFTQEEGLPDLAIVSTGGTIASKIDYRTGAVTSQFEAEDIMRAIPGLASIGNFTSHVPATILSENMTASIWRELASTIYSEIESGVEGVIVTHGTDTMSYSAAAVSFMLKTPVPVVFVGSQRSADRPSSDNLMNGLCSAAAAVSDLGEVSVVMHGTSSDDYCAIHRGTRVRKMHTSRRDAFRTLDMDILGKVDYPSLKVSLNKHAGRRGSFEPELHADLEEKVGLVQFYPGMNPDLIRSYDGYAGLVVAGSGLGHTSSACIEPLRELVSSGTTVVMTSQCLNGRVCDRVYDTGRDLIEAGVIEGVDMLPEVAMVKLMWVLGMEDDKEKVRELMLSDLRGELGGCTPHGL
ncbi:Glu-tRNA(Gln) amidotransferase subunit GatD [Methanoplanus endosymbiosus]|uniref:Glutamyl-tRNA(Gln) amidotransferase subunit D n=1 Tax=Methanoplanus endosymbiosus TaxID=33865 RepID=A0A9E7TJJ1_9EURY|nr:Glu-tRNA(Gln) amidotransferase subunit GatD [Methanoplanus endosymbiosus]UUX91785.1 Glu-tRNA(Gln) amidotransferase subunit GatD [Methanoplanus endosymbiosus]